MCDLFCGNQPQLYFTHRMCVRCEENMNFMITFFWLILRCFFNCSYNGGNIYAVIG